MINPNFTAEDLKPGEIYTIVNPTGQTYRHQLIALDNPKKGWTLISRLTQGDTMSVTTSALVRAIRLYGGGERG